MNNNKTRSSRPDDDSGFSNERVLMLVFESINWDPHALCLTACVSRKHRAVANRILWRDLCVSRAPRMVSALVNGTQNGRGGEWHALAKLLFFCCGSAMPSQHFKLESPLPGHFAKASRFSKTSGQSFLRKRCEGDVLYVSDPCEHGVEAGNNNGDGLGVFRGVFKGFHKSRTRDWLIKRRVDLEERIRCPYCSAPVWSMTRAGLVPMSASKRLGSHHGGLEYFVCVNGHLHGICWLVPLSSDGDDITDDDNDEYRSGTLEKGNSSGEVVLIAIQ
ncbi:hypothetical protein GIB67_019524 [Kingdonia uniflora]|uniref:EID1-like F-box protein 3 n=1 Tax=Kingdonia uniflora TaxID=39325 RepID=A0A7J7N0L3_9MAGN|nr:hypothetical protein GIB67_019524 [Kingdonia uniflora]